MHRLSLKYYLDSCASLRLGKVKTSEQRCLISCDGSVPAWFFASKPEQQGLPSLIRLEVIYVRRQVYFFAIVNEKRFYCKNEFAVSNFPPPGWKFPLKFPLMIMDRVLFRLITKVYMKWFEYFSWGKFWVGIQFENKLIRFDAKIINSVDKVFQHSMNITIKKTWIFYAKRNEPNYLLLRWVSGIHRLYYAV